MNRVGVSVWNVAQERETFTLIGEDQFRKEFYGSFPFEYPTKFLKWYERKAPKYAKSNPSATSEQQMMIAFADWCGPT